ncbi:MAG: PQQ-binding-like beta-propeller repeat protein, partial [Planctomycetales bacterium]|nr:PQQ-binding-like beta-propeller repeat protein [Planctomycetales bacterium]
MSKTGQPMEQATVVAVDADRALVLQSGALSARRSTTQLKTISVRNRRGEQEQQIQLDFPSLWSAELPTEAKRIFLQTPTQVFAADVAGKICAVTLPTEGRPQAKLAWQGQIRGTALSMLAADGRLYVSDDTGAIYCFGATPSNAAVSSADPQEIAEGGVAFARSVAPSEEISRLIAAAGKQAGCALLVGESDADLIAGLVDATQLQVIALASSEADVHELRGNLSERGVPCGRAAALSLRETLDQLPPYFCELIYVAPHEAGPLLAAPDRLRRLYESLRPYGGALVFATGDAAAQGEAITKLQLPGARLAHDEELLLVFRDGPLAGSDAWTHQGASAANTMFSRDERVKAPLGVLWFGGPSNEGVLPRHGHGPTPQVVGGRVLIEGADMLRATDAYTGRLLWQRDLPGVGSYYDNTAHHAGANAIGSNYAATPDGVYVAYGRKCLLLDPDTGATRKEFTLPHGPDEPAPAWGFLAVDGDLLLAGGSPSVLLTPSRGARSDQGEPLHAEASAMLVAMDRRTGKPLWRRDAVFDFRHNAICAGG